MYFVESGTLVVLKKMGGDAGDEKAVNEVDVYFQKTFALLQLSNAQVKQGEYFGELALVNHAPRWPKLIFRQNIIFLLRAATVAAKDNVRVACKFNFSFCDLNIVKLSFCRKKLIMSKKLTFIIYKLFLLAVLDTMAFERLLGPCMDIMKRNTEEYEEQLVRVFGSKVHQSQILSLSRFYPWITISLLEQTAMQG